MRRPGVHRDQANTLDHLLLPETLDALKDFQPIPADATVPRDAGYDGPKWLHLRWQ